MNPTSRYAPLSRFSSLAALAAAAATTVASIGSVLVLIHSATSDPWAPAEAAAWVTHCDAERALGKRQACVRAALARREATHVASR